VHWDLWEWSQDRTSRNYSGAPNKFLESAESLEVVLIAPTQGDLILRTTHRFGPSAPEFLSRIADYQSMSFLTTTFVEFLDGLRFCSLSALHVSDGDGMKALPSLDSAKDYFGPTPLSPYVSLHDASPPQRVMSSEPSG